MLRVERICRAPTQVGNLGDQQLFCFRSRS